MFVAGARVAFRPRSQHAREDGFLEQIAINLNHLVLQIDP